MPGSDARIEDRFLTSFKINDREVTQYFEMWEAFEDQIANAARVPVPAVSNICVVLERGAPGSG
jgi:hypothetical protein